MPLATSVQTNFTAGELSPRLFGRTDINRYFNGLATFKNWLPHVHGGASRRPGTRFVDEVRDSSQATILIPFEYSTEQAYSIEFGDEYVRFFRNRAQVTHSWAITAVDTGAKKFTVAGDVTDNVAAGDDFTVDGSTGNDKAYTAATVTAVAGPNTEIVVNETVPDATADGDIVIAYTIPSPYTAAQLSELEFNQSADVLFLTHPDVQPYELRRNGDADWEFVAFDYQDGPYLPLNATAVTMTPSHTSGTSRTLTASSATFAATDVGRLIRIQHTATWGYAKITAFGSSTSVTIDILEDFGGTGAVTTWRLGAWSDTTGWPWVSGFHAQRLYFGGSDNNPQTIWGSVVGDFNNFQPSAADGTVSDDDGVTFTVDDDRVQAIRWLKSVARGLAVGMQGGEGLLGATSSLDPITLTNVGFTIQSTYGSAANVPPQKIGRAVLFAQRAGFKVRELVFNFDVDQFIAPDLTLLAEHITLGKIIDMAYQQEPDSIVWLVLADGALVAMTYDRDQQVIAWHQHPLGGGFSGGAAVVESIAVIPDDPYDLVWLVVKRTVAGNTVRYVEFIEDRFELDDADEDAFFVDSGLTYSGAAVDTVSGLEHLNGETVSVLVNGAAHPDVEVIDNAVTLNVSGSKIHVGLPIAAIGRTMPIVPERLPFDSRGKQKAIYKAFVNLNRTLALTLNTIVDGEVGEPEELLFRSGSDPMDEPPPLFTGEMEVSLPSGHGRVVQVEFSTSQPLPAAVLAVTWEMHVGGV